MKRPFHVLYVQFIKIVSATSIEPTDPIFSPITSEVEHPITQISSFEKRLSFQFIQ